MKRDSSSQEEEVVFAWGEEEEIHFGGIYHEAGSVSGSTSGGKAGISGHSQPSHEGNTVGTPVPTKFVRDLYDWLESGKYATFVDWIEDGKKFTIMDDLRFAQRVLLRESKVLSSDDLELPQNSGARERADKAFKAFHRQMNYHGFQKKKKVWSHPFFEAGKPHLLGRIQSKTPKITTPAKKESGDDQAAAGARLHGGQQQHQQQQQQQQRHHHQGDVVNGSGATAAAGALQKRKRGNSDVDPIEEQLYSIHPTGGRAGGRRLEQVEEELANTQSRVRQLEQMIWGLFDRMGLATPALGNGGYGGEYSGANATAGAAVPVNDSLQSVGALVTSELREVTDTLFQSVPDSDDALFSGGSFDGFLAMDSFSMSGGDSKYIKSDAYLASNAFMERGGSAIAQRRMGKQQQQQQQGARAASSRHPRGSASSHSSLLWFLLILVVLVIAGALLVSKARTSGLQWDKLICGKLKQGSSIQRQCTDLFTSHFFKSS